MAQGRRAAGWSVILCADWSKDRKKREVYAASPAERRVWRVTETAAGWSASAAVEEARGGLL